MEDTINDLKKIEHSFVKVVQEVLKIDMSDRNNYSKVRVTWPVNGSPDWGIDEDVCFIRVTPVDSEYARQMDVLYSDTLEETMLKKEMAYTRVHNINFCFYGPNSYNNADKVRYSLMRNDIIKKLNKINLHSITDIPMPVRIPELFNGRWWDRTDFNANYNELVVRRNEENRLVLGDIKLISNR